MAIIKTRREIAVAIVIIKRILLKITTRKHSMGTFQSALMDLIKIRFFEVIGEKEFGGSSSVSQAQYYLNRVEDNLVTPMSISHICEYSQGSGNKLESKMKALKSSSAMTFNLFGNGPVFIDLQKFIDAVSKYSKIKQSYFCEKVDTQTFQPFDVQFEYQMSTLKTSKAPANLDARLVSTDNKSIIYIETKFTEWFSKRSEELRSSYLEAAAYPFPSEISSIFISFFRSLIEEDSSTSSLSHLNRKTKYKRFDALQMAKHSLGIFRDIYEQYKANKPIPERIMLLNCVWELSNPEVLVSYKEAYQQALSEEHEQYKRFVLECEQIFSLFYDMGVSFSIHFCSVPDLINALALSPYHRQYLERYII